MSVKNIRAEILSIGEENINGFKYSRPMAEEIMKQLDQNKWKYYGTIGSVGELPWDGESDPPAIPISCASHVIGEGVIVSQKKLVVEIKILETEMGRYLQDLLEGKDRIDWNPEFGFKPEGFGKLEDKTLLGDGYSLRYVNYIDNREGIELETFLDALSK